MEVQLSEVRGFGSAGTGELCALPWVVAPQSVGFSLLWAWYNEDRNSLLSSKLLCYFLGNSVCSVGAPPTKAALPSAPLLGFQEPYGRR